MLDNMQRSNNSLFDLVQLSVSLVYVACVGINRGWAGMPLFGVPQLK